jgi:hypothetical protein
MIDLRDEDIVATERTSGDRFIIYTRTDVRPGWPVPWWGVVLDTGGDGFGILARVDGTAAPAGWTGRQLLAVALARQRAEYARCPAAATAESVLLLEAAARSWPRDHGGDPADGAVALLPGSIPSAYAWTVATAGGCRLDLCPDPKSQMEGVTPEQVLAVLRRLLADAARGRPHAAWAWGAERQVAAALDAEVSRVIALRQGRLLGPP